MKKTITIEFTREEADCLANLLRRNQPSEYSPGIEQALHFSLERKAFLARDSSTVKE